MSMVVATEEPSSVPPVEGWVETDIDMVLDSGCCEHVMDAEDAPGYSVTESPGNRRGQNFVVGNGETVPN